MSTTQAQASTHFPEGYGDFCIQSSDNVLFYFLRAILSHVSSVFRDMFTLPNEPNTRTAPLKIAEPSKTTELFLTHLDPNLLTPNIDPDTVEDLVHMADKYQTNVILHWFEREALIRQGLTKATLQEAYITTHPMATLSISVDCNLEKIIGVATKEALGHDWTDLPPSFISRYPNLYCKLSRERNERIKLYQKWIYELTRDGSGIPTMICDKCVERKGRWIHGMMQRIQIKPVWATFISAFDNCAPCGNSCGFKWNKLDLYTNQLPKWRFLTTLNESK